MWNLAGKCVLFWSICITTRHAGSDNIGRRLDPTGPGAGSRARLPPAIGRDTPFRIIADGDAAVVAVDDEAFAGLDGVVIREVVVRARRIERQRDGGVIVAVEEVAGDGFVGGFRQALGA